MVLARHTIDCKKKPFVPPVPKGVFIHEHKEFCEEFIWDMNNVDIYISEKQKFGSIFGNVLMKELADCLVCNANVLDFLLSNPHLIPKEWQNKSIFFFGTIYGNISGKLYVRTLYKKEDGWGWFYYAITSEFYNLDYVAIFV